MKKVNSCFGLFVMLTLALLAARNLKGDELIVKARYLQLACENCYHMEIEAASDETLVGQTIIPTSSVIDIEELIAGALLSGEKNLCLFGAPYLINASLLQIDPAGMKFYVEEQYPLSQCDSL